MYKYYPYKFPYEIDFWVSFNSLNGRGVTSGKIINLIRNEQGEVCKCVIQTAYATYFIDPNNIIEEYDEIQVL